MKKLMLAALVSLAILPGCGKKNDAATVSGVGVAAIGIASVGLQGNCFTLNTIAYGSGATVTFSGSGGISPYSGAIMSTYDGPYIYPLMGAAVSLPGVTHSRPTNLAGNSMQIYAPGSPGQITTIYAVAYLAPSTVNALRYTPVCGIRLNSPVASGQLTMSSFLTTYGGDSTGISI